jgi:hypothetical protein
MAGRTWAGGKPPIAILGLEVYDNGSGIDPETTRAAKELTAALRDRAKAGTGPYTPVQGGDKELIDEKLLNNCDSEAASCMAAIGTELGAEFLMYGKIEKAQLNGQPIYRVSLRLLNVNRKQLTSSTVENIPVDAAVGVKASTAARTWYSKLAVVSGGTVAIRANIDRGTVLLDGDARGTLASGVATLTGVVDGRHTLAVEAKDYQRYETQITVRTGETTTQNVTMVEMPRKLPPGPSTEPPITREGTVTAHARTNLWKPVFYGALVLDASAAGFAIYEWRKSITDGDKIKTRGPNNAPLTEGDCGKTQYAGDPDLKRACDDHDRWKIGVIVGGVLGAAVIGSFYMAYLHDSGSEPEAKTASGGRRKRRELAITPIVTPQGGGATLRFDW